MVGGTEHTGLRTGSGTVKKKLQIFVSSTYTDLIEERQASVEAILRAGHIPAGMELFAAGSQSQMDTIHQWIDESDVFMLILGGRYGSLEPKSGKSYTQLEYEYAVKTKKPYFAVVLTDAGIDRKVRNSGRSVLESENQKLLREFRSVVVSKMCRMVEDARDIKLAIHETLMSLIRERDFSGWVPGSGLSNYEFMLRRVAELERENAELRSRKQKESIAREAGSSGRAGEAWEGLYRVLKGARVSYLAEGKEQVRSVLSWFYYFRDSFVAGIENRPEAKETEVFLFSKVAPTLVIHGLVQDERVMGVPWRRLRTTKLGNEFLAGLVEIMAEATAIELPPREALRTSSVSNMRAVRANQATSAPESKVKPARKPKPG